MNENKTDEVLAVDGADQIDTNLPPVPSTLIKDGGIEF